MYVVHERNKSVLGTHTAVGPTHKLLIYQRKASVNVLNRIINLPGPELAGPELGGPEVGGPELAAAKVVYFMEKPAAVEDASDSNLTTIALSLDVIGGGIELPQSVASGVMEVFSPSKTVTLSYLHSSPSSTSNAVNSRLITYATRRNVTMRTNCA